MKIETKNIPIEITRKKSNPKFGFKDIKPNFEKIKELEPENYDNLVVIGNGGSITSFRALYYAFIDDIEKHVRLVTTMDPDYLSRVADECQPQNTLVVTISKSGETVGVIESMLYFSERGFDILTITEDQDSTLKTITEKRDYQFIPHKDVGGRFSGLTETALVPAYLTEAIDIEKVRKGGEQIYQELENEGNPAEKIAKALYEAQNQNYEEILHPIYSSRLYGFLPLNIQLMHETVCKEEEGQTIYGDMGPEYQHHTNQRLFGGQKNIITLFLSVENHKKDMQIHIEQDIKDIEIQGRKLSELEQNSYQDSLDKEREGVKETLTEKDKPFIEIKLQDTKEKNIGKLIALMQSTAVYSAELRDVNPYNQPDVERSKGKSYEKRFQK